MSKAEKCEADTLNILHSYIVDTYVSYDDMYSHKYEIIYYSKKNV